ncbi:TetR/AcrR family transcriptional regulator [Aidingimonas lacisalsi]|uniref:TetR/AcrR family transcriptional regulator n=1 Tax=Aidingimonas lacisalsi TaxID=2604086 RepID=UPI0011D2BC44|nr:TetR/AcrR family transcriptional regulator [Aidingimonas lacisalsi]
MSLRGRPRAFDPDLALRSAMNLFWERGYEGATLTDLAAVMGINKPSLYAAFGSKEALFRQAVSLYDKAEGRGIELALHAEPRVRDAIAKFLQLNLASYTDPDKPSGCMIVLAAMIGSPENAGTRDYLAAQRAETRNVLRQRLERGVAEGELAEETDCNVIADFYTTVLQGLSIQARDGATREQLRAIAQAAMAGWESMTTEPATHSEA